MNFSEVEVAAIAGVLLAVLTEVSVCVKFLWQEKKMNTESNQYEYRAIACADCSIRVNKAAMTIFSVRMFWKVSGLLVFIFSLFGLFLSKSIPGQAAEFKQNDNCKEWFDKCREGEISVLSDFSSMEEVRIELRD